MSQVGLIYDDLMTKHRCPWDPHHPESPERFTKCLDSIRSHGLEERCNILEPRDATLDELLLIHTQAQVDALKALKNSPDDTERFCSQFDSIFANEHTYDAAVRAAGCTIKLTEQIVRGTLSSGLALVRPPGHNASSGEFSKFCFFNNVAIAAKYAVNTLNLSRVLVVDWDVEHGHGTQSSFFFDPRVLFFSVFRYEHGAFWPELRESNFDYVGTANGTGFNVNVPLNRAGLENWDYLAVFHQILLPLASEYKPQLILVSCGFGASFCDAEGGMRLTPAVYAHMTHMLRAFGPISVVLEGGYCEPALSDGVVLVLKTLLGDPCPRMINMNRSSGTMDSSVVESIQCVITVLKRYWKCFGHGISLADIASRVRYFGTKTNVRPASYSTRNYYKKLDAVENESTVQTLATIRHQTQLITAATPVKTVDNANVENISTLKQHRFVTVNSLTEAQVLAKGSCLLVNFTESGTTAFEESGSTIIINARKMLLEKTHDAEIAMYNLILPVFYKVYPDCVILNGGNTDSGVVLRTLYSLCCRHLSCEGGLILVGSGPQNVQLPHCDFAYNATNAANNIREAARVFELDINQFVADNSFRPPAPVKVASAGPSLLTRCYASCFSCSKMSCIVCCTFIGFLFFCFLIPPLIAPSLFCVSSTIRRHAIFDTGSSNADDDFDFAEPERLGLHCPQSYSIRYGGDTSLGMWYIPPRAGPCVEEIKDCCKQGPVFIFFHGVPGHRGKYLEIPKFLADKLNAHVFTFDYQNYGDSTHRLPSRQSLLADCLAILDTVLDVAPLERIYFWGHSFGTLAAVELAANMSVPFGGLILEAPITDVRQRIELGSELDKHHVISGLRPCIFEEAANDPTINYNSTKALESVSLEVPVLILHAEDDAEVPFVMGKQLYEAWFRYRVENEGAFVSMLGFEKHFGFGHDNIYKYERLKDVIQQFLLQVPLMR